MKSNRTDDMSMKDMKWSGEGSCSRRTFLHRCGVALSGITIIGTAPPLLGGCETSLEPRDPDQNGNGNGNGSGGGNNNGGTGGLVFDVSALNEGEGFISDVDGPDGFAILIARHAADSFTALSTRCTHQGCAVREPANGKIVCPCHGSQFNLTGGVLQGPASQPLAGYQVTPGPENGQITVTTE